MQHYEHNYYNFCTAKAKRDYDAILDLIKSEMLKDNDYPIAIELADLCTKAGLAEPLQRVDVLPIIEDKIYDFRAMFCLLANEENTAIISKLAPKEHIAQCFKSKLAFLQKEMKDLDARGLGESNAQ